MAYHSGGAGNRGWCCRCPRFFPKAGIFRIWEKVLHAGRFSPKIDSNARSNYERKARPMTKDQYIKKIINLMNRCNDLALLDLILRLLVKSL